MGKQKVVVCCWKHGHETELWLTKKQEEKLQGQIPKLKAVCPTCRNETGQNEAIFVKDGQTLFSSQKVFRCRHGHVSVISAFTNNMLHVKFGPHNDDFENVEGTIADLENLVDSGDIACNHDQCGEKLEPVDDSVLSLPGSCNFKTKNRLGDLWEKSGAEPVRPGAYDNDGYYRQTKSEIANKHRLEKMRNRNIPEERHPGKRITKPTDRRSTQK